MVDNNLRNKLGIIVPTYNHFEIMQEWFRVFHSQNKRAQAEVWIYDSSDNDKTKILCERQGELVHYVKKETNIIADIKAMQALMEVPREYLWLCGDGVIVNPDLVYDILEHEISNNIDVIHFFGKNKTNIEYKKKRNFGDIIRYSEKEKTHFFKDFWWSTAMWGISVINKRVIKSMDMTRMIKKYGKMHFIYPTSIFCALAEMNNSQCVVYCHNCFTANSKKTEHTWGGEDVFKIWSQYTVKTIRMMPKCYNQYKKVVWSECWVNNGFLRKENLIKWNQQGYFCLFDWIKNFRYLSKVTNINRRELLLISLGKQR